MKELKQTRKLEAEYSDFTKVDTMLFPKTIQYDIVSDKNKMEINIDNSRATTSGPSGISFYCK